MDLPVGGWLERKISPFCKVLKGISHTRANDATVIFLRITLLLVSQATSKIITIKCLLNLLSTWQKYMGHKLNRNDFHSLFSDFNL